MWPAVDLIYGILNYIYCYVGHLYRKITNSYQEILPSEPDPQSCYTIFGKEFDYKMTIKDYTEMKSMPDSSVSLGFSKSMFNKGPVRINFTSHTDIQAVIGKLNLPKDEFLVSAVPEFKLDGHDHLPDYVCVKIPYVGGANDIIVRQYNSLDKLNKFVSSKDVPLKGTKDEQLETYYEIKDKCVCIYTKSFSGFYICGKCGEGREVNLYASCYGSYRRVNRNLQVSITLYVTDELVLLPDYKKRIDDQEKNKKALRPHRLRLPSGPLTKDDKMVLGLTPDSDVHIWTARMNSGNNTPIEPDTTTLKLDELILECSEPTCSAHAIQQLTAIPQKEWHLVNKNRFVPSDVFQGIVNVDICKVAQNEHEGANETTNIAVDLNLEESDRLPKQEDIANRPMSVAVQETNQGN